MTQIVGSDIRRVLGGKTVTGDEVVNAQGEKLGKIEELMIDLEKG